MNTLYLTNLLPSEESQSLRQPILRDLESRLEKVMHTVVLVVLLKDHDGDLLKKDQMDQVPELKIQMEVVKGTTWEQMNEAEELIRQALEHYDRYTKSIEVVFHMPQ